MSIIINCNSIIKLYLNNIKCKHKHYTYFLFVKIETDIDIKIFLVKSKIMLKYPHSVFSMNFQKFSISQNDFIFIRVLFTKKHFLVLRFSLASLTFYSFKR